MEKAKNILLGTLALVPLLLVAFFAAQSGVPSDHAYIGWKGAIVIGFIVTFVFRCVVREKSAEHKRPSFEQSQSESTKEPKLLKQKNQEEHRKTTQGMVNSLNKALLKEHGK